MSSLTGNMGYTGLGAGSRSGDIIPKGYVKGKIQQYNPQQMQLFNQGINNVGPDSYLAKLAAGDQSAFDEMEQPAFRQFNELQGNISSRFSGQGLGGRHSSGFQNAITAAGSNFAQDLAARRGELRNQAIMDLHNMSQQLLGNRPEEQFLVEKYRKPKTSFWGNIAGKFASAVPSAFGTLLGG